MIQNNNDEISNELSNEVSNKNTLEKCYNSINNLFNIYSSNPKIIKRLHNH